MTVKRLFVLSLIVHMAALSLVSHDHVFDFSKPVDMAPAVDIDLRRFVDGSQENRRKIVRHGLVRGSTQPHVISQSPDRKGRPAAEKKQSLPPDKTTGLSGGPGPELPGVTEPVANEAEKETVSASSGSSGEVSSAASRHRKLTLQPPLRKRSEFLAAAREKLAYRIVLLGVPVGEALLEAVSKEDGITITLRVKSNATISSVYPVDDFAETRLVCGNYLVTTIRQHEGEYTRNAGFTLMLREKKVFSGERLRDRFVTEPLPRADVLDMMSGFYFLRNQPMEVGKTMLLHLYDGDKYVPTEVEVLRSERVRVAGLGEVGTLVVHPLLTTPGFFRRTGDITVWLTADAYKVPVRMETSIPLGTVTAELVSSEAER